MWCAVAVALSCGWQPSSRPPAGGSASVRASRARPALLAISDAVVAEQLDTVPVFAVLLPEDGKLYGSEEGETMVYMSLADANRVLAQLTAVYSATQLQVLPLPLGHVLMQAGLLERPASYAGAADAPEQLRMSLVASPEEKKAARRLRGDGVTAKPRPRGGAAGKLQVRRSWPAHDRS